MADIQAEGLRAAGDLLERVLEPESRAPAAPPSSTAPTGDYTGLVNAWAGLLQQLAAGLARPEQPGRVTVPVDSGAVGPPATRPRR